MFEGLANPQIIDTRVARFSNLPAYLTVGRGYYENPNLSIASTMIIGSIMQPGRMTIVNCMVGTAQEAEADSAWASWRPVIMGIMGTFVPKY